MLLDRIALGEGCSKGLAHALEDEEIGCWVYVSVEEGGFCASHTRHMEENVLDHFRIAEGSLSCGGQWCGCGGWRYVSPLSRIVAYTATQELYRESVSVFWISPSHWRSMFRAGCSDVR